MGFERMVGLEFSIDLLKDIVNINSAMNIFKDQSQWWQDCIFIQGLPQQDLRCVYSIIHWEKISLLFLSRMMTNIHKHIQYEIMQWNLVYLEVYEHLVI